MTKTEVVERLCTLMSRANNVSGWSHPADCICGESDARRIDFARSVEGRILELVDGKSLTEYQNDGAALDVIERLINEELKRLGFQFEEDVAMEEP